MTTLGQLKTSVDSWLARDDIAVSGGDFTEILLIAESHLTRDLRLTVQEETTTLTFTGRSQDLPADYIGVRDPFIDDETRRIEYMTPATIRRSSAWENGRVGAFYTLEGNPATSGTDDRVAMIIAGPASAASSLSLDVNYWKRFPALSDDADTNWLLVNHYDIPLYACLKAAGVYLQDEVLQTKYETLYAQAIADQARHEHRKRYGAVPKQRRGNQRGIV